MSTTARTRAPLGTLGTLLRLIRFSHTLFALPWALAGLLLGSGGWPAPRVLLWVLVAMVAARTAAMTWNRLVDRRLDATNPRTANRPSVTGEVGSGPMLALTAAAATLFVFAAWRLNPLCGWLSLPTLVLLLGYSLAKRITSATHFLLGLALGLAPLGAYLAARGSFDAGSLAAGLMGAAVLLWTAGFDVIYACQDVDHDRGAGLHSVPARLGVHGALAVARTCHAAVPLLLAGAALAGGLAWPFWGATALVAALLVVEARLVRPEDLSRIETAFFQVNVGVSIVVLIGMIAALAVGGSG